MLKKLLLVFLLAFPTLFLASCGDGENPSENGSEVAYSTREGIIRELTQAYADYPNALHALEIGGSAKVLLKAISDNVDLDKYVGDEVILEGIVSDEENFEAMKVVSVEPKDGTEGSEISYSAYKDPQLGFSLLYPTTFEAKETRKGVAFLDDDEKTIELIILANPLKQDLDDWLVDTYGYTKSQLNAITVGGLTGYQFQNQSGVVIYLAKGEEVFTLAWYDNSTSNRARNRKLYLEIVQSFSLDLEGSDTISTLANEGEFCGGIAGIRCKSGLKCELEGDYPDAGGSCVRDSSSDGKPQAATADSVSANAELPTITSAELQRGWYYGDREEKKPGTPDTWILVNSGSRSAMWRRVDIIPESEADYTQTNVEVENLSSEEKKVFTYLKSNINTIAVETSTNGIWSVRQLAFAQPNFVYATYSNDSITRRLLLVYTVVGEKVSVELQAYFKPGEDKDWLVIEGSDSAFGKAQTVVDARGELTSQIREGYREYTNRFHNFSLQYPKNWYWQNASSTRAEFAEKPFPAALPRISAEVVEGNNFNFGEVSKEDGEIIVYAKLDEKQSVKISGDSLDASILEVMGETLKKN